MSKNSPLISFGRLIGASRGMKKVYTMVEKAAKVDLPVLIVGETGTGKELAAQEIHERSHRKDHPFVAVNMGALTSELIASELFGHVKGSFTGAVSDKVGRFEETNGGTLFLDEVATMDDRIQVALLRVLENETFRPVGAKNDRHVDVRIIAATNEELSGAVTAGHFREDLLHRFQVMRIDLPPLREHPDDLPMLIEHYLALYDEEFDFAVTGISNETLTILQGYAWPGNIRELKNVIAQASVMAEKGLLQPKHLPEYIRGVHPSKPAPSGAPWPASRGGIASASEHAELADQEGLFVPMGMSLDEVQKSYILKTLAHCGNNKTKAAKLLGISRKTLHDRLNKWNARR